MANCILSFANLRTFIFTSAIFVVAPLFAAEQPCDGQPFSGEGQLILAAAKQLQNSEDTDAESFWTRLRSNSTTRVAGRYRIAMCIESCPKQALIRMVRSLQHGLRGTENGR